MKRLLQDWGMALLVGVGIFFAVELLSRGGGPAIGAAPEFSLVNVAGGTTSLADYRGKTVVLNFWGSWCGPCRSEIPEFAAWSADHPDVPVLGIAVRSGAGPQLAAAARKLGITYPVLESDEAVLGAYRVEVYPTTVVVDGAGNVVATQQGAIGRTQLDRLVASAH